MSAVQATPLVHVSSLDVLDPNGHECTLEVYYDPVTNMLLGLDGAWPHATCANPFDYELTHLLGLPPSRLILDDGPD